MMRSVVLLASALPHWARKSASLFQPREKLSIELAPAKKAGDGS